MNLTTILLFFKTKNKQEYLKIPNHAQAKFCIGELVKTSVTHESRDTTVGNGKIIGFHKMHKSYWAFSDNKSVWYHVKMESGKIVSYPQERLQNLSDYVVKTSSLIERNKNLIGEPGFSFENYLTLSNQILTAKRYYEKSI